MTNENRMTPEETIKRLKEARTTIQPFRYVDEAIDYAIKALEQQSCEDCISREAVKDMLTAEWTKYMPMELDMNLSFVLDKISALPSVTPRSKVGHWEYVQYDYNPDLGNWHCSECRCICTEMHSIEDAYNYCPNCGCQNIVGPVEKGITKDIEELPQESEEE